MVCLINNNKKSRPKWNQILINSVINSALNERKNGKETEIIGHARKQVEFREYADGLSRKKGSSLFFNKKKNNRHKVTQISGINIKDL